MSDNDLKTVIKSAVNDLVASLIYYDRKEDEDLPRGVIERLISEGEISADEIAADFKSELFRVLKVESSDAD